MINLYQAILAQSSKGEFDDILADMELVQKKTQDMHLEKDLLVLGLGVQKEINILTCILRARRAITNYAFQDACIALYQTKHDLLDWKRICQEQDYAEKSSAKPDEVKETMSWRFPLFSQSDVKNNWFFFFFCSHLFCFFFKHSRKYTTNREKYGPIRFAGMHAY
jgi:hypothetical protein